MGYKHESVASYICYVVEVALWVDAGRYRLQRHLVFEARSVGCALLPQSCDWLPYLVCEHVLVVHVMVVSVCCWFANDIASTLCCPLY